MYTTADNAFWVLLGAFWVLLGAFWALLAALGPLLAALGRLLGGSWALLAALGAILERHAKIIKKSMPKMTDVGSQKGAQREPNSVPKRTKIYYKNRREKNTPSRSSWGRLGTILDRFVAALGLIFVDFSLVFKAFRENSLFSKDIVSKTVLDRS